MAKTTGVWGIDVGRCALKALRCRLDGSAVVAEGFDYIEYPKLLTQPDADAPQLVKEALQQFVSRNELKGDKIVVSVPGEAGLAKFFKPPPVDVKKIADIVKYEARQQIPYQLDEVIWDFQQMPGGQEVDGFAMESEIGLFAMKREQVNKALNPYKNAEIEVDVIQLSPMAVYNFFARDIAQFKEDYVYQAEKPPGATAVLSLGVDTSDLVVTDGFRLWQRNVPLGGSHFTKQLSKELKLTFGRAEQLKRNPRQAEDPKAVFQAMRPVFGDIVTELQRSVGFFHSLYKKATVERVMLLGNTSKLPGLPQYLGKHLGLEVIECESFPKLSGAKVVSSPAFKENLPSFAVCYGLCLQGLGQSKVFTNLLPRELLTQRLIKAKKPWAVAGVAAVSLACALNFVFHYQQWNRVHPQFSRQDEAGNPVTWEAALSRAQGIAATSTGLIGKDKEKETQLGNLRAIKTEVVGSADRRVLWLELTRALNEALPAMDPQGKVPEGHVPDNKTLPFQQRQDLKIEYIETQRFNDLGQWFTENVKRRYLEFHPEVATELMKKMSPADPNAQAGAVPPPTDPAAQAPPGDVAGAYGGAGLDTAIESNVSQVPVVPPKGPGWVIEIGGYHFYNADPVEGGSAHLKRTLLRKLEQGGVALPVGPGGQMEQFSFKELGIDFSILVNNNTINKDYQLPNPNYVPPANAAGGAAFGDGPGVPPGGPGAAPNTPPDPDNVPYFKVPRYDFVVQFAWQEKPLFARLEERQRRAKEAAAAAAPAPAVVPAPAPAAAVPPAAPAAPPAGGGPAP